MSLTVFETYLPKVCAVNATTAVSQNPVICSTFVPATTGTLTLQSANAATTWINAMPVTAGVVVLLDFNFPSLQVITAGGASGLLGVQYDL